jgi:integrase
VRLHDLRHSFASVGVSGGASLPIIGRLLGHTKAATTEKYSHLAADPIRAANEAVGNQIEAMMRGRKAEVFPLKAKVSRG